MACPLRIRTHERRFDTIRDFGIPAPVHPYPPSLVAWRLAPGGAPEKRATGDFGALEVVIPGAITFTPGTTYQLWLQGRNAKGQSDPGPVTLWVAP